jgi:hypothetical protein
MNTMKRLRAPEGSLFWMLSIGLLPQVMGSDTARWKLAAYGEVYFQWEKEAENRPAFLYSYNRNGTASANLALLQLERVSERTILRIGAMDGAYARANLASEPRFLRHVFEARFAWKPKKNGNSWLEAGVFPSHIGNESALGMQCPTLTRSLMADNSPYYESGLRWLGKSANGKREGGIYVLNGWQRMRLPGHGVWPALGHQLTLQLNPAMRINSSSFLGNPGDNRGVLRAFHDAWMAWDFRPRWTLHAAYDIGWQRQAGSWQTASVVLQHRLPHDWVFSARAESFLDPNGIIIPAQTSIGSRIGAYSFNADYVISEAAVWRMECRWMHAPFPLRDGGKPEAWSFNTALCFQVP